MTPKVGELWRARGLWSWENEATVRIIEIFPSGMLDVNYCLDPTLAGDLRVLPPECLLRKIAGKENAND